MKKRIYAAILTVLCCVLIGHLDLAPAEGELVGPVTQAELMEAAVARRTSPEFSQRLEALQEATRAHESAIAAIPEIQAIDQELERLRARTRELMRLRSEVIRRHEAALKPLHTEIEQAEQDLLQVDPVRQLREEVLFEESVASDASVPQS